MLIPQTNTRMNKKQVMKFARRKVIKYRRAPSSRGSKGTSRNFYSRVSILCVCSAGADTVAGEVVIAAAEEGSLYLPVKVGWRVRSSSRTQGSEGRLHDS